MLFIYIVDIFKWWYEFIIFGVLKNPFLCCFVLMWTMSVLLFTYLFFYLIAYNRFHYLLKSIWWAIVQSSVLSLFMATFVVAFYNVTMFFIVTSDFFKHYHEPLMKLLTHGPEGAVSLLHEQQMIGLLFLFFGIFFSFYFVSSISYHLKYEKNSYLFIGFVVLISLLCYGVCMSLGYV
ncbi:hypothetical protein HYV11_02670 [Candidatus Dependentiae bacterium]|nr:hypothetical protein [Candidatus Dependentiae bacterium]